MKTINVAFTLPELEVLLADVPLIRTALLRQVFPADVVELPNGATLERRKAIEIANIARQGEKIQAIKDLRNATGLTLIDSKNTVEKWAAELF